MRVTEIRPGRQSRPELLAESEGGVFLDYPYGGQVRGGQFRVTAIGWRIVNGLPQQLLGLVALQGRPLTILRQIEGIASDSTHVDCFAGCTRDNRLTILSR